MVAIKGFEMPKSCDDCMFCVNIKNNDYGRRGDCWLTDESRINLLEHVKPSNCPLVEIKENEDATN